MNRGMIIKSPIELCRSPNNIKEARNNTPRDEKHERGADNKFT